jgi:hypothetical protein
MILLWWSAMIAELNQLRTFNMADPYKRMVGGRSLSTAAILEIASICVNIREELIRVGRMCHSGDGPVTGEAIRKAAGRLEVDQFMGNVVEEHNVFC